MATDADAQKPSRCPSCGAARPTNAPGGLCPRCLMRQGLESDALGHSDAGEVGAASPAGGTSGLSETLAATVGSVTGAIHGDTMPVTESPADLTGPPELTVAATGIGSGPPSSPAGDRDQAARGLVIADRYVLQEKLGEGGMGEVWTARQTAPVKRIVALKLIKAGMDSRSLLARFEQERQALAMMDHPNIARVLDGGLTPSGRPFFAMELVNGLPLTTFCDEAGLGPRERLELFVPVCQAVQHAHQKGIIHRDLKPANILVTLIDGRPVPKVIDFGVAKAIDEKLTEATLATQFGSIMGTLEYMAPEQAGYSGVNVDTRADIYSLGVILYELLTGLRPIDARRLKQAALLEMIRIIREEDPQTPSTRLSTDESLPSLAAVRRMEPRRLMAMLRGELDWIVMKCLEKQRDRRYDTASGLERDLRRYLSDEPIEARPPSRSYRIHKFLRRHRAATTAAMLVLLAVLIGAVAATWQAVRATRAERVAVAQRNAARQAQQAEAEARGDADSARADAERSLAESRRLTARLTYDRAQRLCEQGEADAGLLWMARSLELTPPDSADLDRAIRTSINLWARQLNTIVPSPSEAGWDRSGVEDVDFSPDGLSLLTVDTDGVVRLWERATGQLRLTLPMEEGLDPAGTSPDACFSPDGRYVAGRRGDHFARIWLAASGEAVGAPLAHETKVDGIGFHPDGKLLATVSGGAVRFWDIERGEPIGDPLATEDFLMGVELSRDGRRLLAWGDHRLLVWDYPSRELAFEATAEDLYIHDAGFSPDGRLLLADGVEARPAGSRSNSTVRFWEIESGRPIGNPMSWWDPLRQGTLRARFRPDGKVLATGGFPVRLWEVPTGKPLGTLTKGGAGEQVAWAPDGRLLAAFGRTSARKLLDVAPGLEPDRVLAASPEHMAEIVPSPDGKAFLLSAGGEAGPSYELHDLATGEAIGEAVRVEGSPPWSQPISPAFSPDGRLVATPVQADACRIREVGTGRPLGPKLDLSAEIGALAFSPDGSLLAVGDWKGLVLVWDARTGLPIGEPIHHEYAIGRLRFAPDGRTLLVAGGRRGALRGEARLWDATTGGPLGPKLETDLEVLDAAFSPDGRSFATASFEVELRETATSNRLWAAPTYARTPHLAFSGDGLRMLTVLQDSDVAAFVLDARSGVPTARFEHEADILDAAFSPDGRLVLTCSSDLTARLWDASTGLPLGPPWVNLEGAPRGCFTPDGRGLVIRSDSSISRWSIPGPIEGTPERVRLGIEVATRLTLGEHGEFTFLGPRIEPDRSHPGRFIRGADPFPTARDRLRHVGGLPGLLRRD